jgi:translation initiation factor IF-2
VVLLDKARVYELAKELNTTSKRLMEKLGEINIDVKNHMSLLEPDQLTALYKHIGIVKHDDNKRIDLEEKKTGDMQSKADSKKDSKKDTKSVPRIIRTTEIIIDSKNDSKEQVKNEAPKNEIRGDVRGNTWQNQRQDVIKRDVSTSGLRPGFTRDTHSEYKRGTKQDDKPNNNIKQINTKEIEHQNQPIKIDVDNEIKEVSETVTVIKNETHPNAIPEIKEDIKTIENKQELSEQKAEPVKAEPVKTENQPNIVTGKENEAEKPSSYVNNQARPYTSRPPIRNDRPQGGYNRGPNDRPQGGYSRGANDRPQGGNFGTPSDRPQGGNYQGQGDRPQGGYNRGPSDRPQGGYNRGPSDRPQGGNYGGQSDRPQGGYNRGPSDRPQGGNYQGSGDRPQGSNYAPSGDRPQGTYNRGPNDRPQGTYNRGPNDRPQGGYNRGPNDRPQGGNYQGQGDRPQGGFNRGPGDRPQGGGYNRGPNDRPQGGNYGNRPQTGFRPGGARPLEIPKPELSVAEKEELNSQKSEIRREFQNKDVDKDVKREQKKEIPKTQAAEKSKRFRPQRVMLGDKKGVSEIMSDDFALEEYFDTDGIKRKRPKPKKFDKYGNIIAKYIPPRAVLTLVTIPESITVKDLAETLKKTSTDVIKKLMGLGVMATLNHEVDFDTATIIADEFGIKTEKAISVNEEDILFDDKDEEDVSKLVERPPVVVVMGHVDHGKTSLLDAIRETNVIESEAGGITQHIGAYMVKINHRNITFLDTPGHEAFTAMRARGAQVTDIAILVVAADDGVMPQTIEAIDHAKAANVSIIVAINKIDKPGADAEKVKQELTQYGIVAEEWGGDAIMVPVSAKKRLNIDHLLEMVLLAADVLELKANPDKQAKGTIIEAKLDKSRGPLATVLVQRGTLNIGDSIVTGTTVGRIRAMVDDKGHSVKKAGPSMPVEILGMPDVPEAGEIFYAINDEKVAKQLAEKRKTKIKELQYKVSAKVTLEDLYTQIKAGKVKDLNLIVKADVQGSVEAVKQSLVKQSNDEVRVKIVHSAVGAITESDVTLAQVSSAIIIGFNVRPGTNVAEAAENAGVEIKLYRVIYNAIEDVQAAMKGMLEPTFKEVIQGHTEIRQIFKVSNVGTIAGCYVLDGKIIRNSDVRVVRAGIVVHEGKLASLKRFKDDVKEVAQNYECGLAIEKFNDIKEGDIVESYVMEEVAR